MGCDLNQYRARIGRFLPSGRKRRKKEKKKKRKNNEKNFEYEHLNFRHVFLLLYTLLLCANIEPNPGPWHRSTNDSEVK